MQDRQVLLMRRYFRCRPFPRLCDAEQLALCLAFHLASLETRLAGQHRSRCGAKKPSAQLLPTLRLRPMQTPPVRIQSSNSRIAVARRAKPRSPRARSGEDLPFSEVLEPKTLV